MCVGWWQTRRFSLIALAATLLTLLLSIFQPADQINWLYQDNGIVLAHLQAGYGLLALLLLVIAWFEPRIRQELRDSHALGVMALVGMTISILVVRVIKPDEAWRFFRSAGFLWFVIVHALLLCALAVRLSLEAAGAAASTRTRRYAWAALGLAAVIILAAHAVSVGSFMGLDLPDEMWLGSTAVNYARHGDFYSSYLWRTFGNPDPFLPRYYLLMGGWVRRGRDPSLTSLRAFSLLVGAAGLALTGWVLLRQRDLTPLQKAAGVVVMTGLSGFVRASHNLRMDVGLAIYGALLLWALLGYLRSPRMVWIFVMSGALLLGIEMIPPLALVFNLVIGCALMVLALQKRSRWRHVVVYAGLCLCVGAAYILVHFWPDLSSSLQNYANYARIYYGDHVGFNFAHLIDFVRTSAFLSPAEGIVVVGALVLAWRTERSLCIIVGAAAVLGLAFRTTTYGYLAAFAPFIAYFAARAFRSQLVVTVGTFILIPALVSAPIYDMTTAAEAQVNRRTLDEIDLLSWRVPEGATVWGDTVFWFTLHDKVNFIGRNAPENLADTQNISVNDALRQLGVTVIICNSDDLPMCDIGQQMFGFPYVFRVTNNQYWMYSALGSQ